VCVAEANGATTFVSTTVMEIWLDMPRAGLTCGLFHWELQELSYMLAVGGWTIDNSTGTPMRVATDYVDLFDWEYK
jgi:hypothetical protein